MRGKKRIEQQQNRKKVEWGMREIKRERGLLEEQEELGAINMLISVVSMKRETLPLLFIKLTSHLCCSIITDVARREESIRENALT